MTLYLQLTHLHQPVGLSTRQVNNRCSFVFHVYLNGIKLLTVGLRYVPCMFLTLIRKASDSVSHIAPLMQTEPVEHSEFKWIIDYLTDTSQCAGINHCATSFKLDGIVKGDDG